MTESRQGPDASQGPDSPDAPPADAKARIQRSAPDAIEASDEGNQHLLHEMRVVQIELENQNEELRRAQADLEASRARYFDLYDLAPVGYCSHDEAGLVQEVNLTAARMFGVDKAALIGKPLTDFIHADGQDTFYHARRQLKEGSAPQPFELLFQRRSHAGFWAWVDIHIGRDARGDALCRVAFTDITQLKQPGRPDAGRDG